MTSLDSNNYRENPRLRCCAVCSGAFLTIYPNHVMIDIYCDRLGQFVKAYGVCEAYTPLKETIDTANPQLF